MRVTPARCERRRPICAATLAAFLTLVAGATGCRSARRSRSVPVPEVTANRDLVRATPVGGAELATLVDRAAAAPGDLGLLLQASRRLLAMGRRAEALARVEAGERHHGGSALWLAMRAQCLQDPAAQRAAAEAALRRDPDCLPALVQLGRLAAAAGDHVAAASCYARGCDLDPFDAQLYECQGREWALAGERFKAASCYWACIAVEHAPGVATPSRYWAALASLYDGEAAWPTASSWFRGCAGGAAELSPLPANSGPPLPPPPTLGVALGLVLAGATGDEAIVVVRHTTADIAGVKVGDRVLAICGRAVPAGTDIWQRANWLSSAARPGEPVAIRVERAGAELELTATAVVQIDWWREATRRLEQAQRLAASGDHAAAARLYGEARIGRFGSAFAVVEFARETERAGRRREAITMLEDYARSCPWRCELGEELGRMLAMEGTWERLDELLGRTRGRFPESGTLAALAGLVADHAGRADEARAAFARGLLLEHGGDAMVQLAVRLDQRATEVLAAERRRRQEEEKRLAAEQRAAERKRRNEEFARLWLMQQYGVGRIGGSGGGADTGYQYTGPGIVDQWSNQQMLNGMWSHNMGR
ncbi:MAG: hypothetical protein U1E73_11245 [Planctomycetota bacterium]